MTQFQLILKNHRKIWKIQATSGMKDTITYKIKSMCTHTTELSDIPLLHYFKTSAFNSYHPSNHIHSTTFLYHKMNCLTLVNNCQAKHLKNCMINETDVRVFCITDCKYCFMAHPIHTPIIPALSTKVFKISEVNFQQLCMYICM